MQNIYLKGPLPSPWSQNEKSVFKDTWGNSNFSGSIGQCKEELSTEGQCI